MTSNTKNWSSGKESLLDRVLEGKDSDFQARVLEIVAKFGLRPHDPIFLIMVSVGQLQVLLERSPKDLNALFHQWSDAVHDKLETTRRTAVKGQEVEIAAAVKSLIQQTQVDKARGLFTSVVPAAGLLAAAIGVGILLGLTVPVWLQGGYSSENPRKLTMEEAEALRWATSKEGLLARNIMRWNAGSLDTLDCLKDVERLDAVLKVQGRPAKGGFCVIWTLPPEKRQFESELKENENNL